MTRNARMAAGFTLIELMIVVGIIGILSSVAIPEFTRLTLRSKQSERMHVMNTIKSGVMDLYLQYGDLPPNPGGGGPLALIVGDWNPPLPAGSAKRMPNWSQGDWPWVFQLGGNAKSGVSQVEGPVYYSYYFSVIGGSPATLTIASEGDLDSDGNPSDRVAVYQRDSSGLFRMISDSPPGSMELGVDDGSF